MTTARQTYGFLLGAAAAVSERKSSIVAVFLLVICLFLGPFSSCAAITQLSRLGRDLQLYTEEGNHAAAVCPRAELALSRPLFRILDADRMCSCAAGE